MEEQECHNIAMLRVKVMLIMAASQTIRLNNRNGLAIMDLLNKQITNQITKN